MLCQLYRDPHSKTFLLARQRKEQQLCDVVLKVQGKDFPAHKIVLAAITDYFLAMFTNNLSEKTQSVIELREMESAVFEKIVEFVYTEEITVTTEYVQDLMSAACLLQIKGLQSACSNFLENERVPYNCLGIRKFAKRHSAKSLYNAANVFCQRNFKDVIKHTEFLQLPMHEVAELVGCNDLRVCTEEPVFEAVMKWVYHDVDKRRAHLFQLMKLVRLPMLTARYLTAVVDKQVLLKRCFRCRDLLDEAKKFHLRPDLRSTMRGHRFLPRTGNDDVMVVIGGFGKDYLDRAELYRPNSDKWIQIPTLSTKKRLVSAAAVGSVLYAIGGYDGTHHLNTVECMDFSAEELVWKPVASMGYRRGLAGVTVHADMVYICSGYDGYVQLKSMERYSPIEDRWEVIGDLSMGRDGLALTQYRDCIYFIGGFDGINALDKVEV
ncbi:hypothetical protein ACJMK2_042827 [Sinanodonta woodiana]|uniref:BTB domain-containing protein n=1 Tax=Sinanodonta woodiana TaxID=1069815 RepID=A0ABD3VV04_SINWO